MTTHHLDLTELIHELETNTEQGLSREQAALFLEQFGPNELKGKKKKTNLQRFFDQFKDAMILILLLAAVISFVIACREGDLMEFFEPALIVLIVVLNAVMGVLQESRAEKALEALKGLSAPRARVIREGRETVIDAAELVPGDVILLEAGDFVPADARLIRSASLKTEESALTGESVPAEKSAEAMPAADALLGDRVNMVFSGCSVAYGTGRAVVTATGMHTEMGKIAGLLEQGGDQQTPLQQKLAILGKYLGVAAILACVVIFFVGILDGVPLLEIFMTSVSLAVSAIPEGLPAIVTIVLSVGVQRMVKRNAIIRRLPAVETLGSASVICSDKTGTLTQNRMTLVSAAVDGGREEPITAHNSPAVRRLLQYAALCCDGSVTLEDGRENHIGDPTETAIVLAALKNGMPKTELAERFTRLGEIPFDSDRKLMSVVCRMEGRLTVIVKGAFDVLADRCTGGDIQTAEALCSDMSARALRVLAVAWKTIDELPTTFTTESLEQGLTFMGLVGMIDPPRTEVAEAVALCRRAGIRPVMITGDHVVTAAAIADALEIRQPGEAAITGTELSKMSDAELDSRVRQIAVYARVSPEDKIRIVKAWQRQGEVVSMTGDGVNDAPALSAADIGCAMGITGTDVAKGAADMILTDDNFSTIVEAVREGRGIYANIKKVIGFLLGTNIGEVLTVFFAMLLWRQTPLLSMQLLWINLVTDSLPAIALGMEPVEADVMEHMPKPKAEGLFAHGLGLRIVLQGCLFALLTLTGYYHGRTVMGSVTAGQTMAFFVLAVSQVIHAFNMRSERSLFRIGPFGNRRLNWAALSSIILVALVMFTPVRAAFGLVSLPAMMYLKALGLSFLPVVVLEAAKVTGVIRHHH